MGKDDFKYLTEAFDSKILDLVKQKGFYPYEYMNNFGKFREEFPSKEKLYSLLTGKNISDKEYVDVLKVWQKFKMKKIENEKESENERLSRLLLEIRCFIVS